MIRPDELKAGLIDHALFMVVECTNGRRVWPAKGPGVGRPCSELGLSNRNAPALGQHYYLQMSDDEIRRLDAPKWQRTILRAMADYGLFVGDTGGNGGWGFKLWSGLSYLPAGPDPWVNLARRFGIPGYPADDGTTDFHFDMSDSVAWSEELRVASPCVSRRSCRSPGR